MKVYKKKGPVPLPNDPNADSDDEDIRASAMIAAPPVRDIDRKKFVSRNDIPSISVIRMQDEEAMKLAGRNSQMFTALRGNTVKRKKKKRGIRRNRKSKQKPKLTDREFVKAHPEAHPFFQQRRGEKLVSTSIFKSHNIDLIELKQVLRDFYAFYDPITSEEEILEIVEWTSQNGVEKLNQRLKAKYGSGLLLTEATVGSMRQTVIRNHREVAQSAKIVRNLETPGLQDSPIKKTKTFDEKSAIESKIAAIEQSRSPEDTKENLIKFYEIAEPGKIEAWEKGEIPDFIGQILMWVFRFGVAALCDNMREKYGLKRLTRISDASPTDPGLENRPLSDAEKWTSPDFVRNTLERFYIVYNPERLQRPFDELISFIIGHENGISDFNQKLRQRYNDDLFTFEDESHVKWRGELIQKLYDFFAEVDPSVVASGLNHLIYWTERQPNKMNDLNAYLKSKYGKDLNSY